MQAEPVCDGIVEGETLSLTPGEPSIVLADGSPLIKVGLPVTRIPARAMAGCYTSASTHPVRPHTLLIQGVTDVTLVTARVFGRNQARGYARYAGYASWMESAGLKQFHAEVTHWPLPLRSSRSGRKHGWGGLPPS